MLEGRRQSHHQAQTAMLAGIMGQFERGGYGTLLHVLASAVCIKRCASRLAMEEGVSNHVWEVEEILALIS